MLILIGHPCTADVRALSCLLGSSLGKMLLSALRGRLWHLQMKQSQFHPERRDQCNAGDIRNLVFKMYFVLYSLSQCPNTLLSTAKLLTYSLEIQIVIKPLLCLKTNLAFCHQSHSLIYFRDMGAQEWGASPREEWHRHSLCTANLLPADGGTEGFAPSLPLLLLMHHNQFLARAHKRGSKALLPVPGCPLEGVHVLPPFGKTKLGTTTHQQWLNPEVSSCPQTLLKVQQSHDINPQDTKVLGPLFESKLSNLFKEQD